MDMIKNVTTKIRSVMTKVFLKDDDDDPYMDDHQTMGISD